MERIAKYFLVSLLVCMLVSPSAGGETPREPGAEAVLWQIGEFDNDNMEFSLSPNHFGQYDNPGIFIAGITDPDRSWPYILPGKLDTWAGNGDRPFEVLFHLDRITGEGECRLVIDFLDTHSAMPPRVVSALNGHVQEQQAGKGNNDWLMAAQNGSGKENVLTFTFPAAALAEGENRLEISATEGSWALWDALRFIVPEGVKAGEPFPRTLIRSVKQQQLLLRSEGILLNPVEVEILHTGKADDAILKVDGIEYKKMNLLPGVQLREVGVPYRETGGEVKLELESDGKLLARRTFWMEPVRQWELHLIHQTHLDIGFTHTQEEVLEMQTGYLHQALELIEETKDYPEEARFRWHPEGMWAIDEFLSGAGATTRSRFLDAVRDQSIHLDAFYVHLLSGLATGEELIELMQPAKDFQERYRVPVRTAIGSDIPGYSWGLVPAMASQGIKFFNMAPNNNHRLGHLYHWADRPFYWVGPDGYSKVLTWMASHAYIYFWDAAEGLGKTGRYLDYLNEIEFPYEIAMLRYEIGGDNGHPDPSLPEKVKAWNEKYAVPRIIISTNSMLYDAFTERYHNQVPEVSGDLTPYWEDGATSTAADLGLSRRAGERLVRSRVLESMIKPGVISPALADSAWNGIIMYDEHTWGAWCSISDPFAPFTVSQEKYKRQFALDADSLSRKLEKTVLDQVSHFGSGVVDVYNTNSWIRSGLVLLSQASSAKGDRVTDVNGQPVESQRLSSGELAFLAEKIPPFGSRRFRVGEGEPMEPEGMTVSESGISNSLVSLHIDPVSGCINSIMLKDPGHEFVSDTGGYLNNYLYMEGRETGKGLRSFEGPVSVSIEDAGPLVATLRIESGAPGCSILVRRIRMHAGSPVIEVFNELEKLRVMEPEGVYFTFPLSVPGGRIHIDIPWGVIVPETSQLPGANRNYYPVQRWLDISNEKCGLTWVTVDAPMVTFEPFPVVGKGRGDSQIMAEFSRDGVREWWLKSTNPGASFNSWVMSNHWEVNYKAYQEGRAEFHYALIPHGGGYSGFWSERKGREICQPLVTVEADRDTEPAVLPFTVKGDRILATSLKPDKTGDGFLLRLYNPGPVKAVAEVTARNKSKLTVYSCTPSGDPRSEAGSRIELPGYGVTTLRIYCNNIIQTAHE